MVLRDRLDAAGLGDRVVVDSAGTSSEEVTSPIDPRAAQVLREAGCAVPDHRAAQVSPDDLARRDLVLAMTARHAAHLRSLAPERADRVRMLRSFDPAAPSPRLADESALDVDDPWYGDLDDFVSTLRQIEAAADAVVDHVRQELIRGA